MDQPVFALNDSVLTVDFSINLLGPARGNELIAQATVLRTGRTLAVCGLEAFAAGFGSAPVHVATGRHTIIRLKDTADHSSQDGSDG